IFRRNFFVSDTLKSFAYSLYVTVFKVLLAEQVSEARDSEGQDRCSGYLMYVPKALTPVMNGKAGISTLVVFAIY
ncbi:MAG: hypothetical protein U9R57_14265, partial [Thermodesulfobacteriota bacterium]|nr:hypothetical protein [Thermodesulfobacteriota bacterium]